jgi:hypothetical protein
MSRWCLVLLAACGGSENASPGADAPADSPSATIKEGIVIIQHATFLDANFEPLEVTTHIAEFRDGTLSTGSRVDGPCRIDTGINTPVGDKVSGGSITFTGTTATTTIAPSDPSNDYNGELTEGFLYTEGEEIEIVAEGGPVVSAFTTQVVFPGTIVVSDPADELVRLQIDRAAGFNATWTGDAPVRITISQVGQGVFIQCTYDGVTTATVPPSALSDLVAGNTNEHQVSVSVDADTPARAVAGEFGIEILVLASGFSGRGDVI